MDSPRCSNRERAEVEKSTSAGTFKPIFVRHSAHDCVQLANRSPIESTLGLVIEPQQVRLPTWPKHRSTKTYQLADEVDEYHGYIKLVEITAI